MKKVYDSLLLLVFLVVITAPLIGGVIQRDKKWSETEKRALVNFPDPPSDWQGGLSYFREFENYYNDHFGFREKMIFRYQREMEKRFGIAGTPLVLKGEGKWLFYTGNGLIEDFKGKLHLSEKQLEYWHEVQRKRHQWLKDRGIAYLTFAPPNKQTVYPEMMPVDVRVSRGVTRIDQLHEYLERNPLDFYINLHDLLIEAKPQRKLYFSMDTHWNDYGAYVAFREIMAEIGKLFPEHEYLVDFDFHKHYRRALGGDLARMLMIEKTMSERMPKVRAREYCAQKQDFNLTLTGIGEKRHEAPYYKTCSQAKLKAVVFSDSFVDRLESFLSENFSEILYLRKGYDEKNVLEVLEVFKPDIVIEERVERNYFRQIIDGGK